MHYEILNVTYKATDEEIKKAFNKLSKKYHPDKSRNTSQYQKIQRAYEILSDRTLKTIYDTDGLDEVIRYEHAVNNGYVNRRYNKMRPKSITLQISLKEAYLGVERVYNISRKSLCR